MSLNPINAGAAIYIPKFKAITEIPSPKTSASEPSSAKVIIDNVETTSNISKRNTNVKIVFKIIASEMVNILVNEKIFVDNMW